MTDAPEDLLSALRQTALEDYFSGYTAAHRREFLKWIAEAKRPETRKERIAKAVTMLIERGSKEESRSVRNA